MNIIKSFDIVFSGLAQGNHHYEFEVDNHFFEAFEESEILGGELCVEIELKKAKDAMTLKFFIDGEVVVACDRCLEQCAMPIEYEGELDVKLSTADVEQWKRYDGEVLWLNPDVGVLNVADYIYESIMLSLPYQKIHSEDEDGNPSCNPEMLKYFKIVTDQEFEQFVAPKMQKMEEGPNIEALQALKRQMEEKSEGEKEKAEIKGGKEHK